MKRRFLFIGLGLAVAFLGFAIVCTTGFRSAPVSVPLASDGRIFKMSLSASEDSAWFTGAAKFAELVKQKSNGRYGVTVFADSTLAANDEVREVAMVQDGRIDFALIAVNRLEALDSRFQIIALAWMFVNTDDVDALFLKGTLGQELLQAAEAYNLIGLAWAENGFRQVTNSKHEIKTPADVKGLKMRVGSGAVYAATWKALGATTGNKNLANLSAALRAGEFDGQDNSVDVVVSNRLYDTQKHITLWNYSYSALLLAASPAAWRSLDADTQNIIRAAAVEAATYEVQANRRATTTQLKLLKHQGLRVTTLTPEQVNAFRDVTASVYADLESSIGTEFLRKYRKQ